MNKPAAKKKPSNVLVEDSHDLPLVRVTVSVRRGAAEDAPDDDGLTNFAAELLPRGAAKKTRAEIDAAFDALGTSLDVLTDLDAVHFELTVLREKLEPALVLLAEVLLEPDFPDLEAEKLKRELRAQLDELRDDDGQLARRFFQRAFWGAHPYGRSVVGTDASIARLDVERARHWHAATIRAGEISFGLAGDVTDREAELLIAHHFGKLPAGDAGPPIALPDPPARWGKRLILVDKPDRTQSQILFGQPSPKWGTADFDALSVVMCAFGGTFTARLMNEVRSKRGLSYGASARLGHGRGRRSLVMHVFPSLEQTPETVELVLKLWRELIRDGITADELAFAKAHLTGSHAFAVATPEDRLEIRMALRLCGLPADWEQSYGARIRAVSIDDTRRAIERHLRTNDLTISIVSTADALLPKLEAAGLARTMLIERHPFDSY